MKPTDDCHETSPAQRAPAGWDVAQTSIAEPPLPAPGAAVPAATVEPAWKRHAAVLKGNETYRSPHPVEPIYYPETDDTLPDRIAEVAAVRFCDECSFALPEGHDGPLCDLCKAQEWPGKWLCWSAGSIHYSGKCVAMTPEGRPIVETDSGKLLYAPKTASVH